MSGEISLGEYNLEQAKGMTEARFQSVVVAAAKREGWLVYHTKYSLGSSPGYPDLHLVHPGRGLSMFRELKTETGKLSEHQQKWIEALRAAGADVDVWRPLDWFERHIDAQLDPESS